MTNLKFTELTKDNEEKYLDKLANLEKVVLAHMESQGRTGQLFITGKEDISEYVHSKENTVMIALDENDDVKSATYITQGQIPFTYNDITKYFKYGDKYKTFVKDSYLSEYDYKNDMLETYKMKIEAFKYAKEKILKNHPEYNNDIIKFLDHELNDPTNKFHEKSELRETLNKLMSQYILSKKDSNLEKNYEKFYWITSEDISKEFNRPIDLLKHPEISYYEKFLESEHITYRQIMSNSKPTIYEKSVSNEELYYGANTNNSVEIDTYITHPNQRSAGVARILVYEGIKKHIENHFKNPENKEIYLCSTLHRNNLSSKYVSEFFGLKDNIFLKRREGRNREVHICKIEKENVQNYLNDIEDSLIVLYGYNPDGKNLTPQRKIDILKTHLAYEKSEFDRLNSAKSLNGTFTLQDSDGLESKFNRITIIKNKISAYENLLNKGDDEYEL